jgi:TatD DNase family protein
MIDIGVNLTNKSFAKDRNEVIDRAIAAGVEHMVLTCTSVSASESASELALSRLDVLTSTAGIHPHDASSFSAESLERLRQLLALEHVVAAGECGLDFNRDFSPRPLQKECFTAQVELAIETGLPLFMHQRDAHEAFIEILEPKMKEVSRGVVHCFTGTEAELDDYLKLDLHIGITGWICDERRGFHLKEFIGKIPLGRLMIETDAPYLTPRNLRPKPKRGRNEPAFLGHIAAEIADCYGISSDELRQRTTATSEEFFNITRKDS